MLIIETLHNKRKKPFNMILPFKFDNVLFHPIFIGCLVTIFSSSLAKTTNSNNSDSNLSIGQVIDINDTQPENYSTITIEGTYDSPIEFRGFSEHILPETMRILTLHWVTFDIVQLFEALAKCKKLKHLKLDQISLHGNSSGTLIITNLPRIQTFELTSTTSSTTRRKLLMFVKRFITTYKHLVYDMELFVELKHRSNYRLYGSDQEFKFKCVKNLCDLTVPEDADGLELSYHLCDLKFEIQSLVVFLYHDNQIHIWNTHNGSCTMKLKYLGLVKMNWTRHDQFTLLDLSSSNFPKNSITTLELVGFNKITISDFVIFNKLEELLIDFNYIGSSFGQLFVEKFFEVFPNIKYLHLENLDSDKLSGLLTNLTLCDEDGCKLYSKDETFSHVKLFELIRLNNSSDVWHWIEGKPTYIDNIINFIDKFYRWILLSLISFGVFGNLLSCIILSRKGMRNSSTSLVLIGLEICDTMLLVTYIYTILDAKNSIIALMEFNAPKVLTVAKLLNIYLWYPLNKTAYTGSVYLTLLITVERYIAVCYPMKAKGILSRRNMKRSLALVFCWAIFLNFPRWLETIYLKDYYTRISRTSEDDDDSSYVYSPYYRIIYHAIVWAFFMYLIPFAVIVVLNSCIFLQIRKTNKLRKRLAIGYQQRHDDISITKMLITIVILFAICNALSTILTAFAMFTPLDPTKADIVSCIPLIINSSANFIIYCTLGTKFRTEFLKFIKCM